MVLHVVAALQKGETETRSEVEGKQPPCLLVGLATDEGLFLGASDSSRLRRYEKEVGAEAV
jgi:hypothetical protein